MGKAILSYVIKNKTSNDVNELILLTGPLKMIDSFTRRYMNSDSLRRNQDFQEKINDFIKRSQYLNGNNFIEEFSVSFIIDSDKREYLPIIFNDENPIRTRTSALEDTKSEVEKARKLLFRSKDKLFTRKMLKDERFADTTDFNIKLNISEYKEVLKCGITPKLIDDAYYLTINQILEYTLLVDKYGLMRNLIEDTLEIWKQNILALDDELLYYYSRHFRIAISAYDKEKLSKRLVTNLNANVSNLIDSIKDKKMTVVHYPVSGKYQFINKKVKRMEENNT